MTTYTRYTAQNATATMRRLQRTYAVVVWFSFCMSVNERTNNERRNKLWRYAIKSGITEDETFRQNGKKNEVTKLSTDRMNRLYLQYIR